MPPRTPGLYYCSVLFSFSFTSCASTYRAVSECSVARVFTRRCISPPGYIWKRAPGAYDPVTYLPTSSRRWLAPMVNRGSVGWANMSTGPNWTARRRALNCTSPPADLPIARPRPVYRGTGPDRLRGAVTDTRLELGARCQIVSKSGRPHLDRHGIGAARRRVQRWLPGRAGRLRVDARS